MASPSNQLPRRPYLPASFSSWLSVVSIGTGVIARPTRFRYPLRRRGVRMPCRWPFAIVPLCRQSCRGLVDLYAQNRQDIQECCDISGLRSTGSVMPHVSKNSFPVQLECASGPVPQPYRCNSGRGLESFSFTSWRSDRGCARDTSSRRNSMDANWRQSFPSVRAPVIPPSRRLCGSRFGFRDRQWEERRGAAK